MSLRLWLQFASRERKMNALAKYGEIMGDDSFGFYLAQQTTAKIKTGRKLDGDDRIQLIIAYNVCRNWGIKP